MKNEWFFFNNGITICWGQNTLLINQLNTITLPVSHTDNKYAVGTTILDAGTYNFKISIIQLASSYFLAQTTFGANTGFCWISCGA